MTDFQRANKNQFLVQQAATLPGWGASRILALQAVPKSKSVSIIGDTKNTSQANGESDQTALPIKVNCESHSTEEHKLNTLYSVSIAGLDLTGSCLYTAGVATVNAGKLAPLSLFAVTLMLYAFRRVYSEVVTAIPINGGTYNIMQQVSTKKIAGFVAMLSILSYMATAIVSAFDAVVYLQLLWPECEVRLITVVILLAFGFLTSCGVSDSAQVALGMFTLHMLTLSLLVLWGLSYGFEDNFQTLRQNLFHTEYPVIESSSHVTLTDNSAIGSLYFGYASALLGITGFETASNYCESMQSSKVFVSTVNWMWVIVGIYNPLLSLVSLMVLPLPEIYAHPSDMLAVMARKVGGNGFYTMLNVDAVIILCGGVLTAMVGVSGLLSRLASDHIIPEVLATKNSRKAPYLAITTFTVLAISLFLAIFNPTNPTAINDFGGVFAIAFLSVLISFATAAVLLKLYRPWLARRVVASWWQVLLSLLAVVAGFIGNILLTPRVFYLFLAYLSGFLGIMCIMFARVELLTCAIWLLRRIQQYNKQQSTPTTSSLDSKQCTNILLCCSDSKHPNVAVSRTENVKEEERSSSSSVILSAMARQDAYDEERELWTTSVASGYAADKSPTAGISLVEDDKAKDEDANCTSHLLRQCIEQRHQMQHTPFLYLCKGPDVLALRRALRYLAQNEVTRRVYIVHFVDDRDVLRQQTPPYSTTTGNTDHKNHEAPPSTGIERDIEMQRALHSDYDPSTDAMELSIEKQNADWLLAQFTSANRSHNSSRYQKSTSTSNFMSDMTMSCDNDGSAAPFEPSRALSALPRDSQQLVRLVHLLDSLYTTLDKDEEEDEDEDDEVRPLVPTAKQTEEKGKEATKKEEEVPKRKEISCIVVRGMYFCPRAVAAVSHYLSVPPQHMIMGVPDTTFEFPVALLKGVRLVVPPTRTPTLSSLSRMSRSFLLRAQQVDGEEEAKTRGGDEESFKV